MSNLSTRDFDFQGNSIRTVGTDRDLWFVAKDVCEALGIEWKGMGTLSAIPEQWRGVRKLRTPQANQHGRLGFSDNEVIVIKAETLLRSRR